jgi:hypothetical protein
VFVVAHVFPAYYFTLHISHFSVFVVAHVFSACNFTSASTEGGLYSPGQFEEVNGTISDLFNFPVRPLSFKVAPGFILTLEDDANNTFHTTRNVQVSGFSCGTTEGPPFIPTKYSGRGFFRGEGLTA